jgi:hypothetical protein
MKMITTGFAITALAAAISSQATTTQQLYVVGIDGAFINRPPKRSRGKGKKPKDWHRD